MESDDTYPTVFYYVIYVLMIKLKLSLCFINHHAMKTYGGNAGTAPPFLGPARPGCFIPWYLLDKSLSGHCEEKNLLPLLGVEHRPSSPQPITILSYPSIYSDQGKEGREKN
jgi:hypothetical protein